MGGIEKLSGNFGEKSIAISGIEQVFLRRTDGLIASPVIC